MTPRSDKVLTNFRLPQPLLADIDRAAQAAGLNRTEWVISTLTVATREGLRAAALAVAAGATGAQLGDRRPDYAGLEGCAHPKHRRAWEPDGLTCRVCGTVLQRAYKGA